MKINKFLITASLSLIMLLLALAPVMAESVGHGSFEKDKAITISFGIPVDEAWAKKPSNFDVYEKPDPDIKIAVDSVELDPRRTNAILRFKEPLNLAAEYIVDAKDITSDGKIVGTKTICHQEKRNSGSFRITARGHVDKQLCFYKIPWALHIFWSFTEERHCRRHGYNIYYGYYSQLHNVLGAANVCLATL